MKKRLLSVVLSFCLALSCLPCPALGAEADWTGPLSEDALPTLCDTGRGYILYYWYASAIYYSEDKVTWTDLSDRQWVRDAAGYCYSGVGHLGHREFEFLWTGAEYMMRQSLLDDPRGAYQRRGDSPRNSLVTFLDEDFQVIGEVSFDGPVTGIRSENGTYYATVDGVERSFSREAWATEGAGFADVKPDDWFAPYVEVCVEEGLMQGTGEGNFEPERELTYMECLILALRLYDLQRGGTGALEEVPEDWNVLTLTTADGREFRGKLAEGGLFGFHSFIRDGNADAHLYFYVWEEEIDWAEAVNETAATLTVLGKSHPGTVLLRKQNNTPPWPLFFYPLDPAVNSAIRHMDGAPAETWRRQAVYTALIWELNSPTFAALLSYAHGDTEATRALLAQTLYETVGDLEAINDIAATPDLPDGTAILSLYRAGILTGVDGAGTFHGEGTLTRAEAAAMLARIVRPELRISLPPVQ